MRVFIFPTEHLLLSLNCLPQYMFSLVVILLIMKHEYQLVFGINVGCGVLKFPIDLLEMLIKIGHRMLDHIFILPKVIGSNVGCAAVRKSISYASKNIHYTDKFVSPSAIVTVDPYPPSIVLITTIFSPIYFKLAQSQKVALDRQNVLYIRRLTIRSHYKP